MVLMAAMGTYSICWEAIAFHDLLGVWFCSAQVIGRD